MKSGNYTPEEITAMRRAKKDQRELFRLIKKQQLQKANFTALDVECLNRMEAYGGFLYRYGNEWSEIKPDSFPERQPDHWGAKGSTIQRLVNLGLIEWYNRNTVQLRNKK